MMHERFWYVPQAQPGRLQYTAKTPGIKGLQLIDQTIWKKKILKQTLSRQNNLKKSLITQTKTANIYELSQQKRGSS